jgi:hypothetical protein
LTAAVKAYRLRQLRLFGSLLELPWQLPISLPRGIESIGVTMSYLRTAILLAGLTALFMLIGYLIGGPNGAVIAFFVAAANEFHNVLECRQARAVDTRRAGSRRALGARPRSHGG